MGAHDAVATTLGMQEVSIDVLAEKYARGEEKTAQQVRERVARSLASHERGQTDREGAC